MEQALTEYMAKQTRLQARRELEAIADGEPLPKPSHFTKELRKLAAEPQNFTVYNQRGQVIHQQGTGGTVIRVKDVENIIYQ